MRMKQTLFAQHRQSRRQRPEALAAVLVLAATAVAETAAGPLTNDADAWAMSVPGSNDSLSCKVGWKDNPPGFDVVAAPCAQTPATPGAPIVSNATTDTIDVAINPADSDSDLFAIRVSPPRDDPQYIMMGYEYVQADGTIGGFPVWRSKTEWATSTTSRGTTPAVRSAPRRS